MSAIAREFDCTPSAISYIVRKAEAETGAAIVTDQSEPGETPEPPPVADTAPAPVPAAKVPPAPAVAPPRPASTITTLSLPDRGSSQPRVAATLGLTPPPAAPPAPVPVPVPPVAAPAPATASAPEAPRPAASAGETGTPKPGQPPPVDAVEARLRETARGCLVAYRGWRQATGEASTQSLNDAVHELRKVLARIEIDMSASRREEQGLRPIPVPAHRAARQQQQRG